MVAAGVCQQRPTMLRKPEVMFYVQNPVQPKQPSHDIPGLTSSREEVDSLSSPVLFQCKYKLSQDTVNVLQMK